MPRGPIPKEDSKRERRNAPTFETVELGTAPADTSGAPKVPRARWRKLHPETKAWWRTWLEAPQASQFIGTDWRRLFMVGLPLVEAFNRAVDAGEVKLAKELSTELRMIEREFGATPEARLRNRWTVRDSRQNSRRDEPAAEPARPTPVAGDPRLELVKTS